MNTRGLIFGIYPLSIAGMTQGTAVGAPDDVEQIMRAAQELQGDVKQFIPRGYVLYEGSASVAQALGQVEQYTMSGVKWDMVLCYRDRGMELDGWLNLVRAIVQKYGSSLEALQVTSESNLYFTGDGAQPNVRQALMQGVVAAQAAKRMSGVEVPIGFNVVPDTDPQDDFWDSLKRNGGQEFVHAIDFVGLNMYPDVFGERIAPDNLASATEYLLRQCRSHLQSIGIPDTKPMRVSENGWPTGPGRTYERQAEALETTVRTVHRLREALNITHYELFDLRDADSSNDNLFYQFGIMRDDYTPKPAFFTYKQLIAELSD